MKVAITAEKKLHLISCNVATFIIKFVSYIKQNLNKKHVNMQVGNSDLCFTPKENLIQAHKGKINIVIFIFLIPDKKIQYKNLRH